VTDTPIGGATGGRLFVELSKYFLTREYPSKLRQCLDVLPATAVWARTDESSNSIGNLLLHLGGNVREWIVGGVGRKSVDRHRESEFAARDGAGAEDLLRELEQTLRDAAAVLETLTDDDLGSSRLIQGRETTVLGAIYHVVEHFAMHTGQIVLLTKIHAPGAIHFYEDAGALAKPLWKRGDDVLEDRR
jgi:uncharacterized damage-inducible protein DinB